MQMDRDRDRFLICIRINELYPLINTYLSAALKVQAVKSPGNPGNLPRTSITKSGTNWKGKRLVKSFTNFMFKC